MSARITFSIDPDPSVPTARPDTLWCELVRRFMPEMAGEPYGVGSMTLNSEDHGPYLWGMVNDGFDELTTIARLLDDDHRVTLFRDP